MLQFVNSKFTSAVRGDFVEFGNQFFQKRNLLCAGADD